jgi:hypothetical protein
MSEFPPPAPPEASPERRAPRNQTDRDCNAQNVGASSSDGGGAERRIIARDHGHSSRSGSGETSSPADGGKRALKAHVWGRGELDWYVEEEPADRALFKVERFIGHIWDPACGGGNIIRAAIDSGYQWRVVGTDIKRRVEKEYWFSGEQDFLDFKGQSLAQNIVMNPPFFRAHGAEAFIRKALSLAPGKVAAFVDMKFLASSGRANGIYAEFPPTRIWMITPRPSCPPGEYLAAGNKPEGGKQDFIWMVWDMSAPPTPMSQFGWIRSAA